MSCRHLGRTRTLVPGGTEIGGPQLPTAQSEPACDLGRKPDEIGWASRCRRSGPEDGCWWFCEEHGDVPDPKF